jgi:hypothetical protein
MNASPQDDPGVAACVAAVERAIAGLPAGACTVETDVISPGGSRNLRARAMLGVTITPAREGAAALFLVIDEAGVAVLTGTGALRNRTELPARRRAGSTAPTYDAELGAIVEAVVAGRIEDVVILGRRARKLRQTTEITLGDGTMVRSTSRRRPFSRARRRDRTAYAAYA